MKKQKKSLQDFQKKTIIIEKHKLSKIKGGDSDNADDTPEDGHYE